VLVAVLLAPLGAVAWRADAFSGLTIADWAAIRFTLVQAVLSAALSVILAIPVARALARRRFAGRRALVSLLGAPFILPTVVAILGLLAVFGRGGVVNGVLGWLGVPVLSIYGLHGVVLAHVFFNLPLVVRLVLRGWQSIPAERFRLAAQLGFAPRDTRRTLEHPMLWRVLPGAFALVFALCLSSFAVALTLGGGPRATTVELAIYQAFRFDFDLGRAALLGCVQIFLVGMAAGAATWARLEGGFGRGMDRVIERWDGQSLGGKLADGVAIALMVCFLFAPLTMVVLRGAPALMQLPPAAWQAAARSVLVALGATSLMLLLAVPLTIAAVQHKWLETPALLGIAVSPLVLGSGLFLLLYPFVAPSAVAFPITALINAVMALPFAVQLLLPATRDAMAHSGRLAASLNLEGWPWLWLVFLPRLRPALGFAAGLTAALSMGDLGVIALFSDPERATLPLHMYGLMGSYQMEAASGAALLLVGLSFGLFWVFDWGGRGPAESGHAAA